MTARETDTHVYITDPDLQPDHRGEGRCVSCGLPQTNQRHTLPDMIEETTEHRRRVGDREDA